MKTDIKNQFLIFIPSQAGKFNHNNINKLMLVFRINY